jgi:predicted transcriptional regulator YdeE
MKKIISKTWQKFFMEGFYQSILNKKNHNTIGLYTNYENKLNGKYDMMVCCEISNEDSLPHGIEVVKISEGRYAKFKIKGNAMEAVGEFWNNLWKMDLNRKFSFDFEEYKDGCEMEDAEIDIYISID